MPKDHYEVLNLSTNLQGRSVQPDHFKSAYRQALLAHHPDKVQAPGQPGITQAFPTIDEITLAFRILSDPKSRAEYDRDIRLTGEKAKGNGTEPQRTPGLEVIDLDDMIYNEQKNVWTRECRCGTGGGFVITEDDLEQTYDAASSSQEGQAIMIGCSGCSLSIKVMFTIDEG